ncbi:BrnT family toxin [Rhizobium sp. OAE497]|uniref:BrnT family toxin n=1 Tax=Rhizobium sp. OAE497 TaxID=2663796 RepID=UPI0018F402B2
MFEWDDEKNRLNIEKHGVSFDTACRIFDGFIFTVRDRRFDHGEVRDISIGKVGELTVLTVVHTDRNGVTRLISARAASRSERKRYGDEIQKRTER